MLGRASALGVGVLGIVLGFLSGLIVALIVSKVGAGLNSGVKGCVLSVLKVGRCFFLSLVGIGIVSFGTVSFVFFLALPFTGAGTMLSLSLAIRGRNPVRKGTS